MIKPRSLQCVVPPRSWKTFHTSTLLLAKKLTSRPINDDLFAAVKADILSREYDRNQDRNEVDPRGTPNEDLKRYEATLNSKGMIYSPESLSFEAKRPMQQKNKLAQVVDKFEEHQINPLDEYKSFNLLSQFTTEMGRIRPREQTGLSAKNQRRLSKAVRRARALCIIPTTARHPDYDTTDFRPSYSTNFISRN